MWQALHLPRDTTALFPVACVARLQSGASAAVVCVARAFLVTCCWWFISCQSGGNHTWVPPALNGPAPWHRTKQAALRDVCCACLYCLPCFIMHLLSTRACCGSGWAACVTCRGGVAYGGPGALLLAGWNTCACLLASPCVTRMPNHLVTSPCPGQHPLVGRQGWNCSQALLLGVCMRCFPGPCGVQISAGDAWEFTTRTGYNMPCSGGGLPLQQCWLWG
jgi:hypothetical protein